MRRMTRTLLLLLAAAALVTGCRKPLPSSDYIEASNRYTDLLAVQGDAAYASNSMDEVVAQLQRVSPKSSDHAAALALVATIGVERARLASEGAKRSSPSVPEAAPTFPAFAAIDSRQPQEVVVVPDAAVSELARGADFGALQRKYVGCLLSNGPITIVAPDGGGSEAEGFELHDSDSCRSRLPEFGPSVLIVQAGKIAYLMPRSAVRLVTSRTDGGSN